jgi:hypothetical protein
MRETRRMKRMERNNKSHHKKLSEMLLRLKARYSEKEAATVLMDPKISIGDAP